MPLQNHIDILQENLDKVCDSVLWRRRLMLALLPTREWLEKIRRQVNAGIKDHR